MQVIQTIVSKLVLGVSIEEKDNVIKQIQTIKNLEYMFSTKILFTYKHYTKRKGSLLLPSVTLFFLQAALYSKASFCFLLHITLPINLKHS